MKILSFDMETNGLWGKAFAIGAVILDVDEENYPGEWHRLIGDDFAFPVPDPEEVLKIHCPIDGEVDPFVKENVLPNIDFSGYKEVSDYKELVRTFIDWYKEMKAKYSNELKIIVHCGLPVEVNLFIDAHKFGMIEDFDHPFPLIDIASFPEIGTSIDEYLKEKIGSITYTQHDPVEDSLFAAYAYIFWLYDNSYIDIDVAFDVFWDRMNN